MATTEILASGSAAANSSTVTVAAGSSVTLSLRVNQHVNAGSGECRADIQKQGSDSTWYTVGFLTNAEPCKVVQAEGVYRVARIDHGVSFGVDAG